MVWFTFSKNFSCSKNMNFIKYSTLQFLLMLWNEYSIQNRWNRNNTSSATKIGNKTKREKNCNFSIHWKTLECNVCTKLPKSLVLLLFFFLLQLPNICFGNALGMHWMGKQTTVVGNKNRKKNHICLLFSRFGGFWFSYNAVHNGLTSIPWWLPTYFSLLPAMNFNESLPLHEILSCGIWNFYIIRYRFLSESFWFVCSTCVADCSRKKNTRQNSRIKSNSTEFVRYFL